MVILMQIYVQGIAIIVIISVATVKLRHLPNFQIVPSGEKHYWISPTMVWGTWGNLGSNG